MKIIKQFVLVTLSLIFAAANVVTSKRISSKAHHLRALQGNETEAEVRFDTIDLEKPVKLPALTINTSHLTLCLSSFTPADELLQSNWLDGCVWRSDR